MNLRLKMPGNVFYGWWLVGITLFTLTAIITPIFQGLGFFFVALERHFGWSRAVLSVPFSLSRVEGAILGPIEGYLTDRYGSRFMILIGLGILGGGFVAFSMVEGVLSYYVTFLVIFAGAGLGGFIPLIAAINNWFNRHRTKAMAIGMIGINLGALLAPFIGRAMDLYGWRTLALWLGITVWILAVPIALSVRNRPEDYGQRPDGDSVVYTREDMIDADPDDEVNFTVGEAVRTMAFWGITAAHGFSAIATVTMAVHIVPAMTDIGMSLPQAGTVVLTYGVAGGIAQLAAGILGDRLPKQPLIAISVGIQGMGMLVVATVTTFTGAYIFAVLYGIGLGARVPLLTAIRGRLLRKKELRDNPGGFPGAHELCDGGRAHSGGLPVRHPGQLHGCVPRAGDVQLPGRWHDTDIQESLRSA